MADGLDKLQAAIDVARGGAAPNMPVVLCGVPPANAGTGARPPSSDPRRTVADRIACAVTCPACFRLRCSPFHWRSCR